MATPCWPAPVSAMTRVLPSRRVSRAWPSALLILCAPVCARSSRFRYSRRSGIRVSAARRPLDAAPASRAASVADGRGQAIRPVDGRGPAGEPLEQAAQLCPEDRVVAERVVGRLELLERGHQGLGDVATAEVALHPPAPGAVGVEEAGRHRCRAERRVRPVVARRAGTLDEERDEIRVLDRALSRFARELDARRDVDADRGDVAQRPGDVGRREAAGQGDRQFPGDRRGQGGRGALARAARMRPAGRVEEKSLGPGREERPPSLDEPRRGSFDVGRRLGRQVEHLPDGPADRRDRSDRLVAAELDGVGIDRLDDGGQGLGGGVGGDRHEPGSGVAGRQAANRPGDLGGLVDRQLAGRAGHEVQAERIGAG